MLLPDEEARGAVVVHHAGGVAVDAHLGLQPAAGDRVALARRAVLARQELRHDEERDALHAGRPAWDPRQHQMDDVVGQVVLSGRDPDLLAGDAVAAVLLRLGLGADEAEVGPALRLGEVHRARPAALDQRRQVDRALLLGAVGVDGGVGPVAEALVHVERHVGRDEHLARGRVHDVGHPLPAVFRGPRRGRSSRPRAWCRRPPGTRRACAPRRSPACTPARRRPG